MIMMISPDFYKETLLDKSIEELICEKNRLIGLIEAFEKRDQKPEEWCIDATPEVRYRCNLLYLAKACEVLSDAYAEDEMGKW